MHRCSGEKEIYESYNGNILNNHVLLDFEMYGVQTNLCYPE